MFKNKYIKILASCFLVLMALWVATPKVYIHNLLNHNHDSSVKTSGDTNIQQKNSDDCDFDKYNTPNYFNVFNFIFSSVPKKPQSLILPKGAIFILASISNAIYLLRAPPVVA
jgi:hypothetical protein